MFRIGVDIGGTFTDLVAVDESGNVRQTKVLTTPSEPAAGVLHGIRQLLSGSELARAATVVHGTTLATNAIIERKGAVTGLLTTEGFRDVLETAKELRYDLYDVFLQLPEPLVPRRSRLGVPERSRFDGVVLTPLDEEAAARAIRSLLDGGVRSIAVCFLHSYANSDNERRAAELVVSLSPDVPVSLSSDVLPEVGEYPRVSTTVANAYVRPLVDRYLGAFDTALRQEGFGGSLFIMASSGGTLSLDTARRLPVRLVESGPAAGVVAAAAYARASGQRELLSLDMGGTTAKIALVRRGEPRRANELEVARVSRFMKGSGLLLKAPAVELIEIGAGGGSIARVDALGLLRVGPDSAGADPGPACYGRGGGEPTVTDANLVLGYLDAASFLGGAMRLDPGAAERALRHHLNLNGAVADSAPGRSHWSFAADVVRAARGVYDVVNDNMANATAVYTAEQGVDIREFTLFAFGGAAPAHAVEIARRLRVRRVVVPAAAGVLSALGCVQAPLTFDFSVGYLSELDFLDLDRVASLYERLEDEGRSLLAAAGQADRVRLTRQVDMRYLGQRYEVTFELPVWPLERGGLELVRGDFYRAYEAQYGRYIPNVPVEAVAWRLTVAAPAPEPVVAGTVAPTTGSSSSRRPEANGERLAYFESAGDYVRTRVFERAAFVAGASVAGPALVEDPEATTVIPPGCRVKADDSGNLLIAVG